MFCRFCNHSVMFDHHDYVKLALEGDGVVFYHYPCFAQAFLTGVGNTEHLKKLMSQFPKQEEKK